MKVYPGGMRALWLMILIMLLSSGCLRRHIVITSEPSGARVFLDGKNLGPSPVDVPFSFHGTRRVDFIHEDQGETRYRSLTALVAIQPPFYSLFPLDFLVEHLWPFPIDEVHRVHADLEPAQALGSEVSPDQVLERARGEMDRLRERADKLEKGSP